MGHQVVPGVHEGGGAVRLQLRGDGVDVHAGLRERRQRGVGLAASVKDRHPVADGFVLIAFASLTPMIFVMLYGMLI